ncbi:MAG: hypothetical protein DRN01_06570, partial [Thermoplasmata archaeon]
MKYALLTFLILFVFLTFSNPARASQCRLVSASINSTCIGDCSWGGEVQFSGVLEGDCYNIRHFQIDAVSDDSECNIEYEGGDASGIFSDNPNRKGNEISGTWFIPELPDKCKGKPIKATYACIYDGPLKEENKISCVKASGNIEFKNVSGVTKKEFINKLFRHYLIDIDAINRIGDKWSAGPSSRWHKSGDLIRYGKIIGDHRWEITLDFQLGYPTGPIYWTGMLDFNLDRPLNYIRDYNTQTGKIPDWLAEEAIDKLPFKPYPSKDECRSQGYYWYDGRCNLGLKLCTWVKNLDDCESNGCWIWNNECHGWPQTHLIKSKEDCLKFNNEYYQKRIKSVGASMHTYWWDNSCHNVKPRA